MITKRIPIFLVLLLLVAPQADAFWGFASKTTYKISKISKSSKALPDDEIIKLSKLSDETKGAAKIGRKLDDLDLPNEVLEDTYMRIAIHQKKVTRKEKQAPVEKKKAEKAPEKKEDIKPAVVKTVIQKGWYAQVAAPRNSGDADKLSAKPPGRSR